MQLRWAPSHLNVHEKNEADALASMGRQLHPYPLPKRLRVTEWDPLGLEPMEESGQLSDPGSAVASGAASSDDEGMGSSSSSQSDSEGFSTDVSDWAWERAQELCSLAVWGTDYSTDVSDNRQQKGRRVIKSTPDVA